MLHCFSFQCFFFSLIATVEYFAIHPLSLLKKTRLKFPSVVLLCFRTVIFLPAYKMFLMQFIG